VSTQSLLGTINLEQRCYEVWLSSLEQGKLLRVIAAGRGHGNVLSVKTLVRFVDDRDCSNIGQITIGSPKSFIFKDEDVFLANRLPHAEVAAGSTKAW